MSITISHNHTVFTEYNYHLISSTNFKNGIIVFNMFSWAEGSIYYMKRLKFRSKGILHISTIYIICAYIEKNIFEVLGVKWKVLESNGKIYNDK